MPNKPPRRPRGGLESDVKAQTDRFSSGVLVTKQNKPLTPYRIACAIADHDAIDVLPSNGSITIILKHWQEIGFVELSENPVAFVRYTDLGLKVGLSALKAAHFADKKAKAEEVTQARINAMQRHPSTGGEYSATDVDYEIPKGDYPPLSSVG